MLDPTTLPFIQANRFQPAHRERIQWIVIHTMEVERTDRAALNCARDFATTTDARSAHYCIDNGTIIHCVEEKDIAFAAPPNALGIQLEHAGFASLTAEQWHDDYSQAMLHLSAELAASIAHRYAVPVVWLSVEDLVGGRRGFTSHANISNAFQMSTHQDPGAHFPREEYLRMVQAALDASVQPPGSSNAVPDRVLRLGVPPMRGEDVRAVQEALVKHGFALAVDGIYGPLTAQAVRAFQRGNGLSPDSVVGPLTWRTLGLG